MVILIQGLPRVTQFLEQVVGVLPDWASSLHPFPVVTWTAFIEYLHLVVNPLAGDEHLKEVIQQLQLMGEVVYLKCEQEDLIILQPKWLCSTVCGFLLSHEFRSNALISGSYTREEFQLLLPEYEARDMLRVLSALGICIQVRYSTNKYCKQAWMSRTTLDIYYRINSSFLQSCSVGQDLRKIIGRI